MCGTNRGAKRIEHAEIDRFGVRTRYNYLSGPDKVIYSVNQRNLAIDQGASVWRVKIKHIRDLYIVVSECDTQL